MIALKLDMHDSGRFRHFFLATGSPLAALWCIDASVREGRLFHREPKEDLCLHLRFCFQHEGHRCHDVCGVLIERRHSARPWVLGITAKRPDLRTGEKRVNVLECRGRSMTLKLRAPRFSETYKPVGTGIGAGATEKWSTEIGT